MIMCNYTKVIIILFLNVAAWEKEITKYFDIAISEFWFCFQGQEYAQEYRLEYQRNESSPWIIYHDKLGNDVSTFFPNHLKSVHHQEKFVLFFSISSMGHTITALESDSCSRSHVVGFLRVESESKINLETDLGVLVMCRYGNSYLLQGGPKKSLHLHATNFNITQIRLLTHIWW